MCMCMCMRMRQCEMIVYPEARAWPRHGLACACAQGEGFSVGALPSDRPKKSEKVEGATEPRVALGGIRGARPTSRDEP